MKNSMLPTAKVYVAVLVVGFHLTSPVYAKDLDLVSAVEEALADNYALKLQQINYLRAETVILEASSEFELQFRAGVSVDDQQLPLSNAEQNQLESFGLSGDREVTTTSYNLESFKQSRRGITYGGGFSVRHNTDVLNELQGGEPVANGTIGISLSTQLNRSYDPQIVQAELLAAKNNASLAQLQVFNSITNLVSDIAIAYWSLVAARQRQEITQRIETVMLGLLRDVTTLIENDEVPRAELDLVEASYAEKSSNNSAAILQVTAAENNLNLLLSQSNYKISNRALDNEQLPEFFNNTVRSVLPVSDNAWQNFLGLHRDIRAIELAKDSQKYLKNKALDNTRRPINLSIEASYQSLIEGNDAFDFENITGRNQGGPSILASIEWVFPYKNSSARAQLKDSQLQLDSLEILSQQRRFALRHEIELAYETVRANQDQLNSQRRALRLYQLSLGNETTKRRLGTSTWIDVVNLTDRVDNAELQVLTLQLNTVIATINLYRSKDEILLSENDIDFVVDFQKLQPGAEKTL